MMGDIKYANPDTIDDALSLLLEYGDDAAVISGGQSLMPMLRQRLAGIEYVIDINGVEERDYIERDGDVIRFGCLVRHADVAASDAVGEDCEILAETATHIGDVQVRNRGTLCGAIAHADPAGDPPVVATALDAEIESCDGDGTHTYDGRSFFHGFYETELDKSEIVTEVRFPVIEQPCGAAYEKYEPSAGAYPTATIAAVVELDDGIVTDATLVTGALEPGPTVMSEAADQLVDESPTEETVIETAVLVGENSDPMEDVDGSAEFKQEMTKTLAKRALTTAVERAGGEIQ
jgi:carbon-monoxide dehydrogenase medium subunit